MTRAERRHQQDTAKSKAAAKERFVALRPTLKNVKVLVLGN